MAASSSNLVDNLAEGINKIKCKDCDCFLEYENVKGDLIKYKCLSYHKDCLMKNQKSNSRTSFLTMISINLYCS